MNAADLFKRETETTDLAAGEVLFTEGESGNCMFVLPEGRRLRIMVDVLAHSAA